ncbi:LLM class flavin-dependent oxidoreductase [Pengzhenrongella sp.]|jgi:alkanesulfonate monooxygenase SsuD/methylene tetrahydromethanopterin reductase-like flavin-dependent oxidoreductase (luciferase family)|uniref:LLM class flavin-dependent oxidoreductase n=1 Tax=Pengzhenrongella sp. TaxID=2888820 RepID=UPI002F95F397
MPKASPSRPLHLGVDLSDAGAHPAVGRTQGTSGQRPFDPERLAALVATAQRGVLDFVLFDDAFSLQPRNGTRPGRLDAALISARVAPPSSGIGIVATIDTIHTEPFHVSKAIATIDTVSRGRAAWQVGVSTSEAEAGHFGRRPAAGEAAALAEADEAIEAVTRLWDSWEDDAEIRDVPSGRFVDRGKLHYVDFDGVHFAVKGPSTAPRPPQGQPLVVVRAGSEPELRLAGRRADVVRIRATDLDVAGQAAADVRREAARWGRDPAELRILLDVYAIIGPDPAASAERRSLLENLDGASVDTGSLVHVGTPEDLARVLREGVAAGAVDGYTVRPASLETDLHGLVDGVIPFLQHAGAFRRAYPGATLRDTLGLPRPANRYAAIA